MKDKKKTKKQLVEVLRRLRSCAAEVAQSHADKTKGNNTLRKSKVYARELDNEKTNYSPHVSES